MVLVCKKAHLDFRISNIFLFRFSLFLFPTVIALLVLTVHYFVTRKHLEVKLNVDAPQSSIASRYCNLNVDAPYV